MGLIRFVQDHNRNKELQQMRMLKEQELSIQQHQVRLSPVGCSKCNIQFQYPGNPNFCPNCGVRFKY